IERAAHRLAVDRDHPCATPARIAKKAGETAGECRRVQQTEQTRKGVVTRQSARQLQEFPEQRLTIARKIGETDATLRPANRRGQSNCQYIQKFMPPRVPA